MAEPSGTLHIDAAAIDKLLSGSDGAVVKVIERATVRVEAEAKRLAPVDTGRLRSSIARDRYVDGDEAVGVVGTNVDYALPQEFGTFNMPAHPFLRPALRSVASKGIQ